jgi:rubrerythrin
MTHLSDMASTQAINNWLERSGQKRKSEKPPLGWRCPVCGKGLGPQVAKCSCWGDICPRIANGSECPVCDSLFSATPSEVRE